MKKHLYLWLVGICAIGMFTQAQGQEILEKTWVLTAIGKEKIKLEVEKTPYITLSEGRLNGFSACNRMMGSYTLERDTLVFGNIGGTKMFCMNSQELENKFLQTLSKTHYWKYKCGKLCLLDKDKKVIMRFKIKK
jgi:heat shock protein HslJ